MSNHSHPARADVAPTVAVMMPTNAGPWCDLCNEYTLDPQWNEGSVDLINGKWICDDCVDSLDIRADVPEPPF